MNGLKIGGTFSGVGGFELAWQQLGGTVAWMCEIDPAARRVLEQRFPGVPVYPDVELLDPNEVEPVDVLTGGSPCQGFSIAGARTGLEHGESRLFADYIRIMDGLAARGLQYALWENVPGVLSIRNDDGERTFPHVVAALVGADRPFELDERVRWNTGMAVGGQRAVAWRVVDSRHFGVPQRRRRVYACVAFGRACEDRAFRAVLAKPEGVRGDLAACSQTREAVAAGVGVGAPFSFDRANVTSRVNRSRVVPGGPANTLAAGSDIHVAVPDVSACLTTGSRFDAETETLIPQVAGTLGAKSAHGGTPDDLDRMTFIPDVAHTLTGEGHDASEYDLSDQAHTLGTRSAPAVLMTMREGKDGGGKGPLLAAEESLTLATGNGQVLFEPRAEPIAFAWQAGGGDTSSGAVQQDGSTPTLPTSQTLAVHAAGYGVRRLTPTECERLQAFPDGWTEPAGSDSARYRAVGNAITVNVARWFMSRMTLGGDR